MRDWSHRRRRRARALWSLEWVGFAVGVAILAGVLFVGLGLSPGGGGERTPDGSGSGPFDYDEAKSLLVAESRETRVTVPGYSLTDVRFTSFDGRRVPAIFAAPHDSAPPYRCVVSQPGLGGNLTSFTIPRSLAQSDYAVLTVEPRSSATPEAAARAAQNPGPLKRMLRGTVIDLRRGLDYLEESDQCLQGFGYLGGSFGGMLGAMAAASDSRVSAAALIGAGGDWRHLVDGKPQFLLNDADRGRRLRRAVRLLRVVDPARWIGGISPRPVLLMNGTLDTFVPPTAARALRAAARTPKEVIRPPTRHDPFQSPIARGLHEQVADFFSRSFGNQPPP